MRVPHTIYIYSLISTLSHIVHMCSLLGTNICYPVFHPTSVQDRRTYIGAGNLFNLLCRANTEYGVAVSDKPVKPFLYLYCRAPGYRYSWSLMLKFSLHLMSK